MAIAQTASLDRDAPVVAPGEKANPDDDGAFVAATDK
jgi:hypothetical protein